MERIHFEATREITDCAVDAKLTKESLDKLTADRIISETRKEELLLF